MSETPVSYQSFIGVDLHKNTVTLAAVDPRGETLAKLTISTKCRRARSKPGCWPCRGPRIWPSRPWASSNGSSTIPPLRRSHRHRRRHRTGQPPRQTAEKRSQRRPGRRQTTGPRRMPPGLHRRRRTDATPQARPPLAATQQRHGPRQALHEVDALGRQPSRPQVRRRLGATLAAWPTAIFSSRPNARPSPTSPDIVQLIELQREPLRYAIIVACRSPNDSARSRRFCKRVPGIGEIWSCIIAAEIGPFDRFPNADALEFWAGLTADVKESAGRTQSGHITKAGSRTLRWALCNAALTLCHSDAGQEAIRQRMIRRTGGIKAKANVGHGPTPLAAPVCHGPRQQALSSEVRDATAPPPPTRPVRPNVPARPERRRPDPLDPFTT